MADGTESKNDESKGQTASDGGNAGHRTAVTAALIGAGGTIVAAAIGVATVLLGPQSGGGGVTSPSAQGPSASGSPISSVAPSAIPKDQTAQYQGTRILTGSGLDLDHTPPDPSWEDLLYEKRPGRGIMVGPALVSASWSTPKAPSRAQCEEALKTGLPAGHVFGHAAPGTAFCMWTNVDNVAFVRIAQQAGEEGIPVDIIVWGKQPT
ncbi:hypothetical protein ACFY19_35620 [Streptosporangium saharense]|uniref:hypothetical protein n=1 Tax=Streptosporangium saharense TaxID=1706840 RepID=UPI0036A29AB2